jgi:hypothetical protein
MQGDFLPIVLWGAYATIPVAITVWGIVRIRHARRFIQEALERDGYQILRFKRRLVRLGPFGFRHYATITATGKGSVYYRVDVLDREYRPRVVWARWGRASLFAPDQLELRWDPATDARARPR